MSQPARGQGLLWLALFALAAVAVAVIGVRVVGHDEPAPGAAGSPLADAAPSTPGVAAPASASTPPTSATPVTAVLTTALPTTAPVTTLSTPSAAPPSVIGTSAVVVFGQDGSDLDVSSAMSIRGRLLALASDGGTHPPCIGVDTGNGVDVISQQTTDYVVAVRYDPVTGGVFADGSGIAEQGYPTSGRVLFHVDEEVALTGFASTAVGPDLSGTCGVTGLFTFTDVS